MSEFALHAKQKNIQISSWTAWIVCGIGALFYCYEYYLRISPGVMASELMGAYHISAATFGHLTAFYYYAYTPMQLPVGLLMDRYGPRRLLVLACLSCVVGTYLFAVGNSLLLAELGRFLVGFGSAFALVGVLKLAVIWLPPEQFGMISGITTTLGMSGAVIGNLSLTALVKSRGWEQTLLISMVAGIFLTLLILLVVRDDVGATRFTKKVKSRVDFKILSQGVIRLCKNRQIWINGLIGSLLFLPTSVFAELWGMIYFKQADGFSPEQAAWASSMIFLGWAVGGPIMGAFSDRIRRRRSPLFVGAALSTLLAFIILYVPNLSVTTVYSVLFMLGVCLSVQVIVFAVGRENSPDNLSATAVAMTNMFVMLGGAIFQPVVGIFLDWHWSGVMMHGVRVYSVANYQFALSILPIGTSLAFLLCFFLRETGCKAYEE